MSKIEVQLQGVPNIDFQEIKTLLTSDEVEVAMMSAQEIADDHIHIVFSFDVLDYIKDRLQHEVLENAMLGAKKAYFHLKDRGRHVHAVRLNFRLRLEEDRIINVSVISDGESIDEAVASLDPALQNETPQSLDGVTIFEVRKFNGEDVEVVKKGR